MVDRVPYLNPLIPMGIFWLICFVYPLITPYFSTSIEISIAFLMFFTGWLLYPLIIIFVSNAVTPGPLMRIVIAVASVVCLGAVILQPFYGGVEIKVLRLIGVAALLVVYVASWNRLLGEAQLHNHSYLISMLKGVAAFVFLPFFGIVYVNKVWRMCLEKARG